MSGEQRFSFAVVPVGKQNDTGRPFEPPRGLSDSFKLTKDEGYGKEQTSKRYSPEMRARAVRMAASATPMIKPVDAIGSRPLAKALAETINGRYKTEVIRRRRSWKTKEQVALETLKWVDWFNNRRLIEPIGKIRRAETGASFNVALEPEVMAAQ
jgi:hypothetical protein